MENSTSHMERYMLVPNKAIRDMGELGGVDTFRVLVVVLLLKNWKNELFVTPNLLLQLIKREKQYWHKQLKSQIQALVLNEFIEADKNIEGLRINDNFRIVVKVNQVSTVIKCVNTAIFDLQASINVNTLFAVFAYLKMRVDRNVGYARVAHVTIANRLGLSNKTVDKAVTVLEANGYLSVKRYKYDEITAKKEINRYKVHDHNSIAWKAKLGLASFAEKEDLSNAEKAEAEIDKRIKEVMNDPDKFSPCVFIGLPALMFQEYYNTLEYGNLFTITSIADVFKFTDDYEGILGIEGNIIVIRIEKLTDGVEACIENFISNSVIPIAMLLADDDKIGNNKLKSRIKYQFS